MVCQQIYTRVTYFTLKYVMAYVVVTCPDYHAERRLNMLHTERPATVSLASTWSPPLLADRVHCFICMAL